MIQRTITQSIKSKLGGGKAIILMGARQVGKTTLLRSLFEDESRLLWLNGDELDVQRLFSNISATRLKAIIGENKYIVIDEAQRIEDIGLRLKLITDSIPEVQLVATGSSSFEMANKVNEPLTGRKWEFKLYPISFQEMVEEHGLLEEKRLIPHRMIYGYYPDIATNPGREELILKELSESYLYKDILMWEQIKKPDHLLKLLQALAYQVGSQVSYRELSQVCGLDPKTVERYIILLEQTYIIFRLQSFSRNLRNELKFSKKIYFYDNGIRNAIINNLNQIESRSDKGALWENFVLSERMKYLNNNHIWKSLWFWRTKQQKEIDLIEEAGGQINAYEFKFSPPSTKDKPPNSFQKAYPNSTYQVIHLDNIEDFIYNTPGS